MRALKVAAGIVIALAALFVIVGEQLAGVSADAVVNARLTTVRAPIAGELALEPRELGSLVAQGELLGSLSDPLVDDIRLNDLVLERGVGEAQAARLSAEVAALHNAVESLKNRAVSYSAQRIRQLEARIDEREAQARAIEARIEETGAALARSEELQTRGVETAAALDRARAAARIAERDLEAAQAEIAVAEIELASARSGVFLGEGYNDAPYSEQRISELTVERLRLEAMLMSEKARIAALDERIDAERRRVNRLGSEPIRANVGGRLWEFLAANGERMQRGQDVLRLVDCRSTIVTATVSESVYNRLRVGDRAEFRMSGESTVFEGSVLRLAGAGAATVYRNLAVAPGERQLQRYDVALAAPGLISDPEIGCAIGRTGRIFFEARPLDRLRALWE